MAEDDSTFIGLVGGALIGAVLVIIYNQTASPVFVPELGQVVAIGARAPAWFAALVPTIFAIFFGSIGPWIAQKLAPETLIGPARIGDQ